MTGVPPSESRCPSCGADVPTLPYCIRCGAEVRREHHARGYSASPDERHWEPRIVSTIFPQLPRASMTAFRVALLVALAIVASLAVAGVYPLAIVVAVVTVPALTVIYLYDVDVYEDQPIVVIALTLGWGVLTGIGLAVVGRVLAPSSADLLAQSTRETLLQQGLVVPLIGLVLGLAGPLILLPYPRFNDVLDGTTFGAVSAGWLMAAQTLAQSASLFDEDLRPEGATVTWLLRLVQMAITVPLLWAGVGGAVAGAFWLRYRVRDGKGRRGLVGSPLVTFLLAAVLVVTAAVAQIVLELWVAVLVSFALAVLALLWLRQLVHIGLQTEAAEIEAGEEIACVNCGESTPRHTFCGECGIAFQALPKGRGADTERFRGGARGSRLRDRLVLGVFGGTLLVAGGAASALALSLAPEPEATCFPGEPCGGPPSSAPPLEAGTLWRSPAGVSLAYDGSRWRPTSGGGNDLVLVREDGRALLELRVREAASEGRPSTDSLPRLLRAGTRLDLPIPHGANIGYLDGQGAWYEGLLDSPQGPRESATVASLVASFEDTTVAVDAVFFAPASQALEKGSIRPEVDSILNTVTWPVSRLDDTASGRVAGAVAGGLRPEDVARAYDIEPLWDRGIRGAGETIALVSLGTFRDEDVTEYEQLMGIEGTTPVVRVPENPDPLPSSSSLEVSLDIDVIRAVAPQATILSYESPLSWEGFIEALKRINDDGRVNIVSISWGKCLTRVEPQIRTAMEVELARAFEAGTSIFVASGDAGAYSCLHSESELDRDQHVETVDWPAASPSVIAVGGTRLSLRRDGSYYSENAWEDTLSNGGTGGGLSSAHRRPSWQPREVVRNRFSNGRRQVPDVAGPADCDSAFFIVYPRFVDGEWISQRGPYGCGTSAAAPFWAAVTALVQQHARTNGIDRLGFFGKTLYDLARTKPGKSLFHDVQTGGNLRHGATRGWDYATGLGSPRVWELAQAVVERLGG